MATCGGAVFAFDRDGDLAVFASVDEAADWLEATDVEDGEYDVLYAMDGRVLAARSQDQQVILSVTDRRDEAALQQRLRDYQRRVASQPLRACGAGKACNHHRQTHDRAEMSASCKLLTVR